MDFAKAIIESRKSMVPADYKQGAKQAEEGGCGVVGFAASVPVGGRFIFEPSRQMHNRGNGKGGGIACACLRADQLGVSEDILKNDYILQIALLDPSVAGELESQYVTPHFIVHHKTEIKPETDWKKLGLPIKPPDIVRYFVRVKPEAIQRFAAQNGLTKLAERAIEDEFVFRNSFALNQKYYAALGSKQAFVLSHARNLMIFKIVGYAENVVEYYGLEDFQAQVWIAHQRYPTKGRVWHPAGSHPFIGMNEALVHNGDFANYYGVTEYLRQKNITAQFLTDTEVSVQLFDLWTRVYGYPLEYVIEALAPTTELDFDRLPEEKKKIYRAIQLLHKHASPDGPWFFIIAQSQPDQDMYNLIGITDTAMLRPQVFALQEGDVSIGLVASEKQAIDATLSSLAKEDPRFRPIADKYWNARGGSYTDGGAFAFSVKKNGTSELSCRDKFGKLVTGPTGSYKIHNNPNPEAPPHGAFNIDLATDNPKTLFQSVVMSVSAWSFDNWQWLMKTVETQAAKSDAAFEKSLEFLTLLNDRRYDTGKLKRSAVLQIIRGSITNLLDSVPAIGAGSGKYVRIDWNTRGNLAAPKGEQTLVVFARDFPPEDDDCDARLEVAAFKLGWKRFIVYGLKGQRFQGCGFGPETTGVRFDLYDASGDYIASGIDGMEMYIHDSAQDQLGQIFKRGQLVIYGDVGQAFMYGAKGGEVYVMGNGAGRPLINAVGKPRVVINGSCLDFLAESFMAGDPLNGGGFVVLNGIEFDDAGKVRAQASPYPGSNLFSLASGGAIYVRDPHNKLIGEQLNGGEFHPFTDKDWQLILPYLQKNEQHFGINVERDLLTVDGIIRTPDKVYRKVSAQKLPQLAKQTVPE